MCSFEGARSDCFRFFFQTFSDFGIRRKLIFLVSFTAEKCTIWKILMKILLVMVTIIKFTQKGIGSCEMHNLLLYLKGLTNLTEI